MSRQIGCGVLLILFASSVNGGEAARVDNYGDPLPPRALVRLGTRRMQVDEVLTGAAYSPDGKRIAAVGIQGDLSIWELLSGKAIRPVGIKGEFILWDLISGKTTWRVCVRKQNDRLLFSPNGKWLAAIGSDHRPPLTLQLFDTTTGKPHLRDEGAGRAFAFSPDGKTAASVRDGRTVVLWDLASGNEKRRIETLPGTVHSLNFERDGALLALVGASDSMQWWDAIAGKRRRSFPRPKAEICAVAVAPDFKHFALGGVSGFLALHDMATGAELHRLSGYENPVSNLVFSPDSQILLSGDIGAAVRLWDVASGKQRIELSEVKGKGAFSPDGKAIMTFGANSPHSVRFFDIATGNEIRPYPGHLTWVATVAFSPDGERVLTSDWLPRDPSALLWDVRSGKVIRQFRGHPFGVGSAVFSPDGRRIATAGWYSDRTVRLWDTETGAEQRRFAVDSPVYVTHATFSPDGKWLAANRWNQPESNGPVIWDIESGKVIRQFRVPREDHVHALAFTSDGKCIVRGGVSGLQMWDAASGVELPGLTGDRSANGTRMRVWRLAFSPDGRWLATAIDRPDHGDGGVRLWEMATRRVVLDLPGGAAVAFAPDSRFLAVADRKSHVFLFDVDRGAECLRLTIEAESAASLAFSPAGRRLISGHRDSTALVWDVADLPKLRPRPPAVALDAKAMNDRWVALRGDAPAAHRAVADLAAAGEPAAQYLGEHLAAVAALDPRQLPKLICDLDADVFKTREAATQRLQDWGADADDALRQALGNRPTLEQKRRIEDILLTRTTSTSEEVRALRAIAVLERIGSPTAQAVLRKLTTGTSGVRLTKEAKASLQRLTERKPVAP